MNETAISLSNQYIVIVEFSKSRSCLFTVKSLSFHTFEIQELSFQLQIGNFTLSATNFNGSQISDSGTFLC